MAPKPPIAPASIISRAVSKQAPSAAMQKIPISSSDTAAKKRESGPNGRSNFGSPVRTITDIVSKSDDGQPTTGKKYDDGCEVEGKLWLRDCGGNREGG
jgi:hypothetical protein